MAEIQVITTDILVIGSGMAGISAALAVRQAGRDALVVSKANAGKLTNTIMSGGLFTFPVPGYPEEEHLRQTLASGAGLCDPVVTPYFVRGSAAAMDSLRRMGLQVVDKAHGFSCAMGATPGGPDLMRILLQDAAQNQVRFLEQVAVTALLEHDGRCVGAVGVHRQSGQILLLRAGGVILATGGAGGLYQFHDNAEGMTGDGYALCLELGLDLIDMEFVQFYPICHFANGKARRNLPGELADAGPIINRLGEDIKVKYNITDKPVAVRCRDRLSIAMYAELRQGNGVDGALLLDIRNASREACGYRAQDFARKIPGFLDKPVPAHPSCHHTMGGVRIDVRGRTALEGLWAAGEVTGGLHGANRIGGNALCEAMVMGETAGRDAAASVAALMEENALLRLAADHHPWRDMENAAADAGDLTPDDVGTELMRLLWNKAGIIRNDKELQQAEEDLEILLRRLKAARAHTLRERCRKVSWRQGVLAGMSIVLAARQRTESRGSHCREDYPETSPRWQRHVAVSLKPQGILTARQEPLLPSETP